MTSGLETVIQSNRWQPRAADAGMAEAARRVLLPGRLYRTAPAGSKCAWRMLWGTLRGKAECRRRRCRPAASNATRRRARSRATTRKLNLSSALRRALAGRPRRTIVTWLILPVVICLSQRLSHACLSISNYTAKLRMAHYISYRLFDSTFLLG